MMSGMMWPSPPLGLPPPPEPLSQPLLIPESQGTGPSLSPKTHPSPVLRQTGSQHTHCLDPMAPRRYSQKQMNLIWIYFHSLGSSVLQLVVVMCHLSCWILSLEVLFPLIQCFWYYTSFLLLSALAWHVFLLCICSSNHFMYLFELHLM